MPYPVSVRSVLEALAATRVVSGEIEMSDLELGEQPYAFAGPAHFEITLTNTGAGIVAEGSADAVVRTPCVRCLCEFDLPVHADVEGFYVQPGHDEQIPEEQEYEHISDDGKIDLEPAVVSSIVVALPFAPLHSAECKGICPTCGADLNMEECGCSPTGTESPFAGLGRLLETGEDESSEP